MSNDTYKYWMSQLKRAKKMIPETEWHAAETRLRAEEKLPDGKDEKPVVNDFRNHYEGLRAYLDQREPSFKVTASPAFMMDPNAVKFAECEQKYLDAVWREQNCQKAESRKLHSVLMRNIGFTMPVFDPEKWMPALKYLPAMDVRLDPDCRGLKENMKWWGYRDIITFKEFLSRHKDLKKSDIELLKQKGSYSLDEDELEKIDEEDRSDYQTVSLWHIFAKGSAVMVDKDNEDELKPSTKTRYIQFAEGLPKLLKDTEWSFKLDHDESLVTILTFNQLAEDLYGFTDYKQMERMDKMTDSVMSYIESDAFYSAIRKYLAGDNCPDDSSLNAFINDTRLMVLRDMLDEGGNPKLKEASLRQPDATLMPKYELMQSESARASGQNELMSESMADFKEVTALGVRFQEQKLHQRVNLRLGGPDGYEKSIQEDAVKMLEIAHQMVPRYSQVLVQASAQTYDEMTGMIVEDDQQQIQELPWEDAKQALLQGGKLLKLGVDAIVGQELAQYWLTIDDSPIEEIRLSTKVAIVPGSTRTITQEQQASDMTEFYATVLFPTLYEPMGRFDLAVRYLTQVGKLKGIDSMEDFLPTVEDIDQFKQEQMQMQQQQMQMEQQQQQMQMQQGQQQAEMEQASKESELQNEAVKNELEIQKEIEKADIEKKKREMDIKLAMQKAQMSKGKQSA